MVRVAVAGGTGHVGQTIVEGLVESKLHDVFVLARKPTNLFDQLSSVKCLIASYEDKDALRATLEEHKIEAVISTLSGVVPFETQVILIEACSAAQSVKRFAPSDWLLDFGRIADSPQFGMADRQQTVIAELRKHSKALEWTLFHNGYFMDYFGQPWAPTHMLSEVPYIDIAACVASIPGTGEDLVTWTHTTDVAKFVARALTLPPGSWGEHTWTVGDKVSCRDILAAAEEARGKKFAVTHDVLEDLRKGVYTPIPANKAHAALYSTPEFDATPLLMAMFAAIGTVIAEGGLNIPEEESLNRHFPDVETTKVLEFVKKWWGGKKA